jgi:myo-inositol-1-phosphate synthase
VVLYTGSTETYRPAPEAGRDLDSFERALDASDPEITPTMIYAYAALSEGVPFANATPNRAVDLPALQELATARHVPIAGKDLKSGQTLLKTVIAPALKARLLGLDGWFSTNILGNRDGEVLDDPDAFRSKELTKSGVLDTILQPDVYPELYADYCHKVAIHYYPPRGDEKEGWDNVDIFGWMGYPMQIKVNFLCRDSILAAPLVLDLALFLDLARRAEWRGVQEWLSFYFKCPMAKPSLYPEHDLFIQLTKLKNTLRALAGEQPITHLGLEYYGDDLALSR